MPIELSELLNAISPGQTVPTAPQHSFEVGKAYFIRGVTMYYTGRVDSVTDEDVVLADAAWIADTGRLSTALESGDFNEVEPFPNPVIVPRGTICDAMLWDHELPRSKK